jgi:hypothetical protein
MIDAILADLPTFALCMGIAYGAGLGMATPLFLFRKKEA